MQKNSEHFVNQQYFDDAKLLFEKYFQTDICLTKQWISNDVAGMGPFYLEYKHIPSNYRIILECQMLTFVIVIGVSCTVIFILPLFFVLSLFSAIQ